MKASFNAVQNEAKEVHDMRHHYRDELDMIIKMKQIELQRTKDTRNKDADLIIQNIEKCKELEDKHKRFRRERERSMLQDSQLQTIKRNDEITKMKNEEEIKIRDLLRESIDKETIILRAKKERHQKEIESCQNHYYQAIAKKNEVKEEDRKRDKNYYEEEKKYLEKMEKDNTDFMAGIRNRLLKNQDVLEFYERLYASISENKRLEYKKIIEKPSLDKLARELEKEHQELMARKQLKNENNQFILEQIENNAQKKEILQYQQAKLEYDMLVEDLERQDNLDQASKIAKKKILMDILNTHKSQIEYKNNEKWKIHCMNMHEARLNGPIKDKEGFISNPEDIGNSIPGLSMAYERKKQLLVMENSLKRNNHFLSNGISSPLIENFKSSNVSRRKVFQPDNSKAHLFNKENHNRQPSDFDNDYHYIRYMNKNQTFDIISNNMK
jgi:hypothetical protein